MKQLLLLTLGALAVAVGGSQLVRGNDDSALADVVPVSRPKPLEVSVAVHFGIGGEYNYDARATRSTMASLGIRHYRDDLPWREFLPLGPDTPARMPPKLAGFAAVSEARPLYILGHPHPLVAEGGMPIDTASVGAFARYVTAAVRATRSRNADYEIWNEWNVERLPGLPPMSGPGDGRDPRSAVHYAVLARAGVAAVRRAAPDARVLVGAAGTDPDWSWISTVVRQGGAKNADGVSVHVYNHCEAPTARTGDGVIAQLERLRGVAQSDGWSDVPIWVTETGWPTPSEGVCGVSRETAANNLAQVLLWSAATPWIAGLTVYQLKDQGQRGDDLEDNFGIVDYAYRAKPAACLVREAVAAISVARSWSIQRPRPGVTVVTLEAPRLRQAIVWSDQPATIMSETGDIRSRPMCGASSRGRRVAIGPRPTMIDLASAPRGLAGLTLR